MRQVYNYLEILEVKKGIGPSRAICKCLLCGRVCEKSLSSIKCGHVKSCGCLSRENRFVLGHNNTPVNYFEDLNDEGVNYWGGFIFGDGSVDTQNKLQVCLTYNNDSPEFLTRLSNFIFGFDAVNHYPEKLKAHFQVTSKRLLEGLSKFGTKPNKTYDHSLIIPNKKMALHVIRGYFDADGWFSKSTYEHKKYGPYCSYNIGICSYLSENLEIVSSYLPTKPKVHRYSRKNQLYEIRVSGREGIEATTNYLQPINKEYCFNYKWDKIWAWQKKYKAWKETSSTNSKGQRSKWEE